MGIVMMKGESYVAMREDLWLLMSDSIQAMGKDGTKYWAKMDEYRRVKSEAVSKWTLSETAEFFKIPKTSAETMNPKN